MSYKKFFSLTDSSVYTVIVSILMFPCSSGNPQHGLLPPAFLMPPLGFVFCYFFVLLLCGTLCPLLLPVGILTGLLGLSLCPQLQGTYECSGCDLSPTQHFTALFSVFLSHALSAPFSVIWGLWVDIQGPLTLSTSISYASLRALAHCKRYFCGHGWKQHWSAV